MLRRLLLESGFGFFILLFGSSVQAQTDEFVFSVPTDYSEIRRLKVDWDFAEDGPLLDRCQYSLKPDLLRQGSWYLSFSGVGKFLKELRERGKLKQQDKICGEFRHGNLAGSSFFFTTKYPVNETLEGLMPLASPRSIWDRVECDKIKLRLEKLTEGEFQLVMIETGACEYVWDD